MDKKYWDKYYHKNQAPVHASTFAEFCKSYITPGSILLDVGCGNGRDSFYFSDLDDVKVFACDQSESAIFSLSNSGENPDFRVSDVKDISTVFGFKFDVIYARFFLHALDAKECSTFLKSIPLILNPNGLIMFECRSNKSDLFGEGVKINEDTYLSRKTMNYEIKPHNRRFLDYNNLKKEIEALDFKIVYSLESSGLAEYKGDDPVIIRIIGQKNG